MHRAEDGARSAEQRSTDERPRGETAKAASRGADAGSGRSRRARPSITLDRTSAVRRSTAQRPHAARAQPARRPVRDRRGARRRVRRARSTATRSRRAFVFACEHHADQRRKSGEDFIVHPVGVAKICAGHAPGHRDAVRGAAARHRRGHVARRSTRSASVRRGGRRASSTASRSSPASCSSRATRRRPRTTAR